MRADAVYTDSIAAHAPIRISPALDRDAAPIAALSRDLIEHGLRWSWREERVRWHIRASCSAVLCARVADRLAGFAIMQLTRDHAHLCLLAVRLELRRRGLGKRLLAWIDTIALGAGVSRSRLEVRAWNQGARAFYRALGYEETAFLPIYYEGREAAIRMQRSVTVADPCAMLTGLWDANGTAHHGHGGGSTQRP